MTPEPIPEPMPEPLDGGERFVHSARSGLVRLIREKEELRLLVEEAVPWVEYIAMLHREHAPPAVFAGEHQKQIEQENDWLRRAKVLAQGKTGP